MGKLYFNLPSLQNLFDGASNNAAASCQPSNMKARLTINMLPILHDMHIPTSLLSPAVSRVQPLAFSIRQHASTKGGEKGVTSSVCHG